MRARHTAVDALSYMLPLLVLGVVAIGVFELGRNITPDYSGTALFGQTATDTLPLKSWLATGALALAAVQLTLALWIYGRLPGVGAPPGRLSLVHRITGSVLILLTVPIAYHCMFAYGVQTYDTRIAVHSIAGSALYGAFLAKIVVVRTKRLPGWTLPVVGGLLIAIVVTLWYTSALWYFNGFKLPSL